MTGWETSGRGHVWRVNPEGRELWERGYSMGDSEGVRGAARRCCQLWGQQVCLREWVQEGGREGARLSECACEREGDTHTIPLLLPSALVPACAASGGWTGQVFTLKPGISARSASAA